MEATGSLAQVKSLKEMYPRVSCMTSKDFHNDPDARLDFMMSRVKDKKILSSFRKAICYNRHLFVGRQVLILNCGVDLLLTLWAIKNDAAHIYGVDTSNAIEYLHNVICANNMGKNVSLYHSRIQDIELPVKEVDIIISNWMGYSLIFDSKCEEVIYARDKWLKKDTGIIFPDRAQLYIVGIQNSKSKNQHVDWWRDVNGFNMSAIRTYALREPAFQTVDESELLTDPVKVWSINLYQVTMDDFQFHTPFKFITKRCGCLEGMLTFFNVQFSKSHTPMGFSTSPTSEQTNWLQTVFYFDEPVHVNTGELFYCGIQMVPKIDKTERKYYRIVIETFSGVPPNLSQVAYMTWYRKSQLSPHDDITKPIVILEKVRSKTENNDLIEMKASRKAETSSTVILDRTLNKAAHNKFSPKMKTSRKAETISTVILEKTPNKAAHNKFSPKRKASEQTESNTIVIVEKTLNNAANKHKYSPTIKASQKSETQRKKQKQKSEERKKRVTKKISAALFFN